MTPKPRIDCDRDGHLPSLTMVVGARLVETVIAPCVRCGVMLEITVREQKEIPLTLVVDAGSE